MPKTSIYDNKSSKDEISEAPQVEELLKNLKFHKAIQSITSRINSAVTLREIVLDVKEDIRKLFNINILTLYLIDKAKKEIFTLQSVGDETKEIRFPIDCSTFAGCVAQKKKMLHIADAYNEREIRKIDDALRFDYALDKKTGITTGQIIVSPIRHNGALLGVMEIMNRKDGETIDDYYQIFLDEIESCLAKAFFLQLDFAETSQKYGAKLDKLIRDGVITSEQMDKALKEAFKIKKDLLTILMEQYNIPKSTIGAALADHFSCPFTACSDDMFVVRDLLAGIEKSSLVDMLWIPLKVVKGKIHVLIDDPSDHARRREIEKILETNSIQYNVALATDILKLIDRSYSEQDGEAQADEKFEQISSINPSQSDIIASTRPEIDEPVKHPDTKIARESRIIPKPEPGAPRQIDFVTAPELTPGPEPALPAQNLSKSKARPKEAQIIAAEKAPFRDIHQMADIPKKHDVVIPKPEIPVLPSLTNIIYEAVSRQASAIHFEPDPLNKQVTLRIRIDGQCLTRQTLTTSDYEKVIDEIKVLANLDVKNRAVLQNGKLKLKRPSGDEINMRVAFIPTQAGLEDTVIHITSKAKKIPLELLGLSEDNYADLVNILRQPRGMIFVVGPAGSGITTTLHACLENINTPEKKIWTAEESVEITQNGLRQVPIDPQKGFDFPRVLSSFLNADPDVIMVSEVHDPETAGICMEASLQGRLILSTLRAENIIDAIEKCLDMGISHLVFAEAMLSIIEQRLIKKLCPQCKEKYHPSREEYEELVDMYGKDTFDKLNIPYSNSFSLFYPKGCDNCGQTGYSGRMCVSEIFIFTPQIKRMIRRKESSESIYQTAIVKGMTTLLQDGISKVLRGHADSRQMRLACLK
jgi:type II secretory ATPase GspE/PulE/Tfp pilus assembly ATPase PilB-like protein